MNIIIEPHVLESELASLGFTDICFSAEGCLHLNQNYSAPISFFKGEYLGNVGVYEVVSKKI